MSNEEDWGVDGNIVWLNTKHLPDRNLKPVLDRLVRLSHGTCGTIFSECQMYGEVGACLSYVVMYMSDTEGVTSQNLWTNAYKIEGYLVVIEFDTFVEIHDVCAQKQELEPKLIEFALSHSEEKTAYVLVYLDASPDQYNQKVELYASSGFANPTLVDETPGGVALPQQVLSLVYSHEGEETEVDSEDVIEEADRLRKNLLSIETPCVSELLISKNLATHLSNYVLDDIEYAGALIPLRYNGDATAILAFRGEPTIGESDDEGSYTVNVPEGLVSFHTHPDIAEKEYGVFIGWPSGMDMALLVTRFIDKKDLLLHLVFTSRGIWSIQLTPQLQMALFNLRSSEDCSVEIENIVRAEFEDVEEHRESKFVKPMDRHKALAQFKEKVNTYTLDNLFAAMRDVNPDEQEVIDQCIERSKGFADHTLFIVDFVDYSVFSDNDVITETLYYRVDLEGGMQCPIPVFGDVTEEGDELIV